MIRERNVKSRSVGSVGSAELLPPARDQRSRLPEINSLELWEIAHGLFSLGYVDDLAEEAVIATASEVARSGWPEWRAA
jgi:hypothetical protein